MAEWWSVEVFHGEFRASRWQESYSASLIESAISHGAVDWSWVERPHGVVFEVCFGENAQWESFRNLPVVRAALDAVPDPVNGLLIYPGRGGGAGAASPRRPRPAAGAGAMELPEPAGDDLVDLTRGADLHPAEFSPTAFSSTAFSSAAFGSTVFDGKAFGSTGFSSTAFSSTA